MEVAPSWAAVGKGADANAQTVATTTATAELPTIQVPEKPQAIPNFAVNDNSRIEITEVTHVFQESMAKAQFSATSVEATV
jgi:hypothetical protein